MVGPVLGFSMGLQYEEDDMSDITYIPCFKSKTTAPVVKGGDPVIETTRCFLVAVPSKAGGLRLLVRPTKRLGIRISNVTHTAASQDKQVLSNMGRSKVWKRSGYEPVPASGEEAPEGYLRIGDWDVPAEAADKVVAQWGGVDEDGIGYSIALDGEMVNPDREGAEDALAALEKLEMEEAMKALRGQGFTRRDTEDEDDLKAQLKAERKAAKKLAKRLAKLEGEAEVEAPAAAVPAKAPAVGDDAMAEMLALLKGLTQQVAAQGESLRQVQADLYEDGPETPEVDGGGESGEGGENGES